jgi:hypothetical protein
MNYQLKKVCEWVAPNQGIAGPHGAVAWGWEITDPTGARMTGTMPLMKAWRLARAFDAVGPSTVYAMSMARALADAGADLPEVF